MIDIFRRPVRAAAPMLVSVIAPAKPRIATGRLRMVWSIDASGRPAARWLFADESDMPGGEPSYRLRWRAPSLRTPWSQPRLMEALHGRRA